MGARDARQEAQEIVGDEYEARVLEPSPPAVVDGEFFADDPTSAEGAERTVVSPVPGRGTTWDEWLADHEKHREWAADRWLGAYKRLGPPPTSCPSTRLALHRLGVYVLSPARRRANTKIAFRWTLGGFGTPFFGENEQVRVTPEGVVRQRRGDAEVRPFGSLNAMADFVLAGPPDVEWAKEFDVPPAGDLDADLEVDTAAAAFLGDWFGFSYSVLEELRADSQSVTASRIQLWPEHFDAAFTCLEGEERITFGASPGDSGLDEPYLYALPTYFDAMDTKLWNATTFKGAALPFSSFVGEADQRDAALDFFRDRREAVDK